MQFIVSVIYPDDWANRYVCGIGYSQWLTFVGSEKAWLREAMEHFIARRYPQCAVQAVVCREADRQTGRCTEYPNFNIRTPEGAIIRVFKVEVLF